MNWRALFLASLFFSVMVALVGLLWTEKIMPPQELARVENAAKDPLKQRAFTKKTRRRNFDAYGLDADMVDEADRASIAIYNRKGEILTNLLLEKIDEATPIFCSSKSMSQRYLAMKVLVVQTEAGVREPIAPGKLRDIAAQPWFQEDTVDQVYRKFERTEERKADATLMGVAAVLSGQEQLALRGEAPWGTGILSRWSYELVKKEYGANNLHARLVQYFALMHVMTTLANAPSGICE